MNATVPGTTRGALPAPRRIAIAWDASGSRIPEATHREIAFLERLLSSWPTAAVDLVVFRNRPEAPMAFSANEIAVVCSPRSAQRRSMAAPGWPRSTSAAPRCRTGTTPSGSWSPTA